MHNMRSLSSSANNPIMPSAIRATLVSSDSVIQPADPYSAVSSNVSCVISHLISSLPTTSLLLSKMDNHVHLKKSQPLMQIIVNAHSALNHTARMEKNGRSVLAVAGYMNCA